MEDLKLSGASLTSAAAFVEGGVQEACDDSCSICLEEFTESEPAAVTGCKHEFHLQCILEWCQRSSQCPMCLRPISLKDPSSQELLDAIEHERNIRMNPPRNSTIFHHPTLGDFELQHLPANPTDSELEERIIQHLAAAAAMGRTRHLARREGHQRGNRSLSQGRPQFLVFSTHPNSDSPGPPAPLVTVGEDSTQLVSSPVQANQVSAPPSGPTIVSTSSGSRTSSAQSSPRSQDRGGPSDLQTLSESVKSRFSAISTRYKESITKSTRGWRERLFSSKSSMADSSSETRRAVDTGNVSENLQTREETREGSLVNSLPTQQEDEQSTTVTVGNVEAPIAASSASN